MTKHSIIKTACLILTVLLMPGLFPAGAAADEQTNDNFATKEATLEDNETTVAIDIQTQHVAPPKVLIYQGTYCSAHGLKDTTIVDGINSVLQYADVDYYAETEHYSSGKHTYGEMKHFKRGQEIAAKDIHRVITENGNHMVTQACLDTLMDTWNKGDYDYLVMIVDGGMSTGLSGGNNDAIFTQILAHRLTDAQYIARRKYAEQLAEIKILYLSAPKYTGDYVLYWDVGNKTSSYGGKKQYWSETKNLTVKSTASIGYWHSHFFVEGMAFLAPEYYLTITDPETGKVILDTPPEVKNIPFKTEQIVYYDQAKTVAERMGDIQKQIVPVTVSMKDVLAEGLVFRSVSVEYSTDNGKTWAEVPAGLKTVVFDEATQTVTAKIDISDREFAKSRFRFLILADVTSAFGETAESGKTNEECIVEYPDPEDPEKPPIDEYEPDPPVVTFTTFDVFYKPGDHGTLTGQSKETFRQYAEGNRTTGSSVSPDTYYVHTGWTCDDDVTLTNGAVIPKGELLTNEQITLVVPTHTITFTAQYETEKRTVTYVVEPDPEWGIPKDSVTPAEKDYHIGTEVTVEAPLRSFVSYAYDQEHKKVTGTWIFTGWDTEDFIIYDDTVITGAWEFTPFDPPPTGDNNPAALMLLLMSASGCALGLGLKKKRGIN